MPVEVPAQHEQISSKSYLAVPCLRFLCLSSSQGPEEAVTQGLLAYGKVFCLAHVLVAATLLLASSISLHLA
jgi:hypothetical protein